jgi:hypothetical protein
MLTRSLTAGTHSTEIATCTAAAAAVPESQPSSPAAPCTAIAAVSHLDAAALSSCISCSLVRTYSLVQSPACSTHRLHQVITLEDKPEPRGTVLTCSKPLFCMVACSRSTVSVARQREATPQLHFQIGEQPRHCCKVILKRICVCCAAAAEPICALEVTP